MSSATAPVPSLDLANIPIDRISESPLNHRKHFAAGPLQELADSIRKVGLLQAVVGRQLSKASWELIIGARRLRAAKLAGLKEIPMRVGEYTDAQVIEIQLIENLQREDVHALEEAAGFKQLLAMPGYDMQTLADKLGHKTTSYITKRLSLLKLVKSVRVMFEVGEIDLSHALRIARLRAEDQDLLVKEDGALFSQERQEIEGKWITVKRLRPVSLLENWINQTLLLKLSTAPWPLDNPDLVPKAGACTSCPKRTGANLALFDDVTDDRCLDVECYTSKRDAQVVFAIASAPAGSKVLRLADVTYLSDADKKKYKADLLWHQFTVMDKKKCGHMETGVFVTGSRMGETVEICRNTGCVIRLPHLRQAEAKAPKNTTNALTVVWDEKEQTLKRQIERLAGRAAIAEVVKKTKTIGPRELRWSVRDALEFGGGIDDTTYEAAGIPSPDDAVDLAVFTGKMDDTKLVKLWVACLLENNRQVLEDAIKAHRIDMKKLAAEVGGPLRAQFKKDRTAALAKAKDAKPEKLSPHPPKKTAAKKPKGRK